LQQRKGRCPERRERRDRRTQVKQTTPTAIPLSQSRLLRSGTTTSTTISAVATTPRAVRTMLPPRTKAAARTSPTLWSLKRCGKTPDARPGNELRAGRERKYVHRYAPLLPSLAAARRLRGNEEGDAPCADVSSLDADDDAAEPGECARKE